MRLLGERIHPDAVRHLDHPDLGVRRQDHPDPDGRLGHPDLDEHLGHLDADPGPDDPYPAKERMGCYLGGKSDVGYPCPERMQTGCCPGEGCPRRLGPEASVHHRFRPQELQGQLVRQPPERPGLLVLLVLAKLEPKEPPEQLP